MQAHTEDPAWAAGICISNTLSGTVEAGVHWGWCAILGRLGQASRAALAFHHLSTEPWGCNEVITGSSSLEPGAFPARLPGSPHPHYTDPYPKPPPINGTAPRGVTMLSKLRDPKLLLEPTHFP